MVTRLSAEGRVDNQVNLVDIASDGNRRGLLGLDRRLRPHLIKRDFFVSRGCVLDMDNTPCQIRNFALCPRQFLGRQQRDEPSSPS